jgi:hypothetical protein
MFENPGEILAKAGPAMAHDRRDDIWMNLYRTFHPVEIDRMLKLASVALEASSCLAARPQVGSRSGRDSNTTPREKAFPHALARSAAKALWLLPKQVSGLVQPTIPFSY